MAYKHILVAVDNDDNSEKVCRRALEIATGCHAKLDLLHVVEPPPLPVIAAGGMGAISPPVEPTPEERKEAVETARKNLEALKALLGITDADVRVIESPLTKETIHEAARDCGANLVVVGSHGRHGLALFLSSSIASEFLKDAPCDLLAVRIED